MRNDPYVRARVRLARRVRYATADHPTGAESVVPLVPKPSATPPLPPLNANAAGSGSGWPSAFNSSRSSTVRARTALATARANAPTAPATHGSLELHPHPDMPAPEGAVGVFKRFGGNQGGGWSHHYFEDDKHFYKLPRRGGPDGTDKQVHSEPAATAAMRELGVNVLGAEKVQAPDGTTYIRYPKLGDHKHIRAARPGTFDVHATPDLHRLALAEWLIHTGDRHGENYVVPHGSREVLPIDYGESWHPRNGVADRVVGLGTRDALGVRHENEYYGKRIKNSDTIDPSLLQDFLAKEGKIKEHAERGIAGLSDQHKEEARRLLDAKFRRLEGLARSGRPATWRQIPTFYGTKPVQPGGNEA